MSARTYSTDIYLTCPCRDCEGRKVRITLRRSGVSHGSPRQPVTKSCTSWCRDATSVIVRPSQVAPTDRQSPGAWLPMIEAEARAKYRPRRLHKSECAARQIEGPIGARGSIRQTQRDGDGPSRPALERGGR